MKQKRRTVILTLGTLPSITVRTHLIVEIKSLHAIFRYACLQFTLQRVVCVFISFHHFHLVRIFFFRRHSSHIFCKMCTILGNSDTPIFGGRSRRSCNEELGGDTSLRVIPFFEISSGLWLFYFTSISLGLSIRERDVSVHLRSRIVSSTFRNDLCDQRRPYQSGVKYAERTSIAVQFSPCVVRSEFR